jgi:predicted Rossmann fold nucleotide-binding protein DprA/Smf involved in DNA uptake
MSVTDDAAALIRRRLAELGDERLKLERTLAVLGSSERTDRAHTAGSGRGPTRKQEVLAQVEASPSIRTAEIAAAIGISTSQVANLLARLKREGALKQDGRSRRWVICG